MTTPVIIDAAVVVFLAAFVFWGAHRGLLRALAGLVIVALALTGAGMFAATFAPSAAKAVSPMLERYAARRVEQAMEEQAWSGEADADDSRFYELLKQLGVESELLEDVTEEIRGSIADTGAAVADAVTGAVLEGLVQSILYGVFFLVAFILLMVLLHVLLGAMGLVMKLPGLKALNALGGGLFGLIEGALLLFLAIWIARKLGMSFETEMLAEAHILRIFTANTPLSVLSFLNP